MPPTRMMVNGVDLSTYDLWVEVPNGWADAPARRDQIIPARGAGGLLSTEAARIAPREWTIEASVISANMATAQAQWDAVKLLLANAFLEVSIEPWTDRMLVCRYQEATAAGAGNVLPGWRLAMHFLAPNPYHMAPVVDSYGLLAGQEVRLILGTAPSPFLARFVGLATRPTLLYRDVNGRTRGAITLNGTLAAGDWLEFDSQTLTLTMHTATGQTLNGAPFLSTGSQLFAPDPMDGTPDEGPSLALDSGSAAVYLRRTFR